MWYTSEVMSLWLHNSADVVIIIVVIVTAGCWKFKWQCQFCHIISLLLKWLQRMFNTIYPVLLWWLMFADLSRQSEKFAAIKLAALS